MHKKCLEGGMKEGGGEANSQGRMEGRDGGDEVVKVVGNYPVGCSTQ